MLDMINSLESKRNKVSFMLATGFINNSDIEYLTNSSINDVICNRDSYKDLILLSIYVNPYLLCNDNLFEPDIIDIDLLSRLIIKRYNEEITEYNNLYNNGDISYIEYYNNVMMLNNLYFNSTKIGSRIRFINSEEIVEKVKSK